MAAADLNLDPARTVLVAGIGCSGKIGDYFRSYSVHVVHGRTMPVATGIKLANRDLTVIAAGGDGDGSHPQRRPGRQQPQAVEDAPRLGAGRGEAGAAGAADESGGGPAGEQGADEAEAGGDAELPGDVLEQRAQLLALGVDLVPREIGALERDILVPR